MTQRRQKKPVQNQKGPAVRPLSPESELMAIHQWLAEGDGRAALAQACRGARLFPWDGRLQWMKNLLARHGEDLERARRDLELHPAWRRTTWQCNRIPRKMHFYWGNEATSFLRYLSVYSFRKLNPDWEINLHIPKASHQGHASWNTWESYDSAHFKGRDYSSELFCIPGLNLREVDFSAFPELEDATEVHKSDFFRWHLMAREGGVYSDIDILYCRPFEDLYFNTEAHRDAEAVICLREQGHIIGFFMAAPRNPMFERLAEAALKHLDVNQYQAIGSTLMNKLYPDEAAIQAKFPGMAFVNLPMGVVYPFDWTQAAKIFQGRDDSALGAETIGVHWFAGNPGSQQFNNLLTAENFRQHPCVLTDLIAKVYTGPLPGTLGLGTSFLPEPTFSILVPTYNQAALLRETLESLLAQGWRAWEALVVDDGSTDETPQVMEEYAGRDARIRLFRKANGGCGSALNEGLRHARGEWICWLSSDDLYEPDALEIFAAAIRQHPDIQFHYSNFYQLFQERGERVAMPAGRGRELPGPASQVIAFFSANYVNGISICIRKGLFDRVGFFKEDLHYAQDFDMWLRMSALVPLNFIDQRPCVTRVHEGQDTRGFPEAGNFDSARACLDFLNAHPFQDLFPFLDLGTPEGATAALQMALQTALNRECWMYYGIGPEPALLERLGEWLDTRCPAEIRPPVREGLQSLVRETQQFPKSIRDVLARMCAGQPVAYTPRDPLACMRTHLRTLEAAGEASRARPLRRYLDRVAGGPDSGAPPVEGAEPEAGPSGAEAGAPPADPAITVVLPTRNRPDLLRRALASLLSQTFKDFEVLVVNDGGQDVVELAQEFQLAGLEIALFDHPHQRGQAAARNTALEQALGTWIAYLDDDDAYLPDHLETLLGAVEDSGARVAFTEGRALAEGPGQGQSPPTDEADRTASGAEGPSCLNAVLHARALLGEVGGFDEDMPVGEDQAFLARLLQHGKAVHVPQVTFETYWREGPSNISRLRAALRPLVQARA